MIKLAKYFLFLIFSLVLVSCAAEKPAVNNNASLSSSTGSNSNNALKNNSGPQNQDIQFDKASFSDVNVVHFAFNQSKARGIELKKLDAQVRILKDKNPKSVTIAGHTDDLGTREYNLALGERRANFVKRYLVSHGVKAQIKIVSYGKSQPINSDQTKEARFQNRRAETSIN